MTTAPSRGCWIAIGGIPMGRPAKPKEIAGLLDGGTLPPSSQRRGGSFPSLVPGISRRSRSVGFLPLVAERARWPIRPSVNDTDWSPTCTIGSFASLSRKPGRQPARLRAVKTATAPCAKLPSDGLFPVDSALGRCGRPELSLAFPESHQVIAFFTGHLDLLDRRDVYAKIEGFLVKRSAA